jgi:hypothetical protein
VASRRSGWRAWLTLLLIVLVNLAGLPALALYAHNSAQQPQGSELVQVGVLGAILVVILITNFLGAATQRRPSGGVRSTSRGPTAPGDATRA